VTLSLRRKRAKATTKARRHEDVTKKKQARVDAWPAGVIPSLCGSVANVRGSDRTVGGKEKFFFVFVFVFSCLRGPGCQSA